MGSSNENPSGNSQLKGLMDVLLDLQILNPSPEAKKVSTPSPEEAIEQSKGFSSDSDQEHKDAPTNTPPKIEVESKESEYKKESDSQAEASKPYIEQGKEDAVEPPDDEKIFTPEPNRASVTPVDSVTQAVSPLNSSSAAIIDFFSAFEELQKKVSEFEQVEQKPDESTNQPLLSQTVEGLQNEVSESEQVEQKPDESTNQPLLSQTVEGLQNKVSESERVEQQDQDKTQVIQTQKDLIQPEKSEQIVNKLVQSYWQKAQQNDALTQLSGSNVHQDVENSISLFERWQRLLLTQEIMDSRQAIAEFKKKLDGLEHQIYEPTELINLILPLIVEILTLQVAHSREDIANAIAPVVDEMIQRRAKQDIVAISAALAPVIPEAVAKQVLNFPGELAKALGPEMSTAIKEQIELERDAMVDALYPVIGSTISKYMAEAIRSINEKIENAFSLEGISRKIRAKAQGISEAELILKESIPFTVQAIFLIHKGSGLIIAEVQPLDQQRLESDMIGGMLTAIRSFVNDVLAQNGETSEIDAIDYGDSKIILEVAGYCYMATVTKGEPPESFIQKMRSTMSTIVQKYGKPVELFDGDPSNVPEEINQLLDNLTKHPTIFTALRKPKIPVGLMIIGLVVLAGIFVPVGIYQYRSATDRRNEEEIKQALASNPELAVYRLGVDANFGTVKLSGKLPNQYLRSQAEKVAQKVEPNLKIQNAIIPVEIPPDPVLASSEVKRVANLLNQIQGAVIEADYSKGIVSVKGAVLQESDAKEITQAFLQIPGVKSVTNTVKLQPMAIASRVYFDQGSSEIKAEERPKITQIRTFLAQYPNKHLKILGHTDPKGTSTENQKLALERAKKVKDVLVAQGIPSQRLEVEGTIDAPIGVRAEQLPLLSRCVEFEITSP